MPKTRLGMLRCKAPVMFFLLVGCSFACSQQNVQNKDQTVKLGPMPTTSEASAKPITGPINYLALGDSTGAGVGAREGGYVARLFRRIAAKRPQSKLTNLCVSGATTADVLRDQLDRGVSVNPNLVTLGIGINDIGHGVSLERFSQNYDEILGTLRSKTTATIIVTNIPEISSAPRIPVGLRSQYQQLIVEYNKKLAEVASRHGVTVFDVYTITHEQLPAHPEYFSADGFHPSDEGYELWAETMWPTIARVIGEDAEGN
ncbi:MAG: SGNH/GDSL hydrolase family protein [Acidobacteriota bacterium]